MTLELTHLQRLEAESIHIIREVVAESERPVMLYSIGKDSSVMLHLAHEGLLPGAAAVPAAARRHDLEVPGDVRRSATAWSASSGSTCIVHQNPEGVGAGHQPVRPRLGDAHRHVEDGGAQAGARPVPASTLAFGGARRDEEKSRAKERVFSLPLGPAPVGPEAPAAGALAPLQRPQATTGESIRVFPLSNWTELDVWQYIHLEEIPIVPLYFAAAAAGGRARRHAHHGRRRPDAAAARARCPSMQQRALPHARLLPADRRDRERRPTTLPEIIQEMLLDDHLRAAGPGDRPRRDRRRWRRRSRRATSDGARRSDLIADDIDAYLDAPRAQGAAALHHLRQRRRRQEHADRPAALRLQADLRGPARRAGGATRKKVGTQGGELDFALLVDGLAAEREQGITIDVAYRFFSTEQRKFIVADTPGHEQYTRNMVTGASTADLAVILIDARKGVLTQTRRHSYLVSLLGIRHVVLAINKMDLVDYSQEVFDAIEADYRGLRRRDRARPTSSAIPMSALRGDNVTEPSAEHALVRGPDAAASTWRRSRSTTTGRPSPFRMPVQWVNRPNLDFRGFAGRDRRRHGAAGRPGPGAALGRREPRSRGSSPTTATSTRRWPASRSP